MSLACPSEARPWQRASLALAILLVASIAANVCVLLHSWAPVPRCAVAEGIGLDPEAELRIAPSRGVVESPESQLWQPEVGPPSAPQLEDDLRHAEQQEQVVQQRAERRQVVENEHLAARNLGESSHDEGPHQQDAMLFLVNALVVGAAIMHIASHFHSMQQTVALFVLGVLYSFVMEGLSAKDHSGVFGQSYSMWMDIDPHLLLFALLPALLAGDAMAIDTSVAKRVAYQCLYLAGPGVLITALVSAAFFKLFLGWDFYLCLVMGSITCATDPVAVVELLKELGASPVLTVQIQGESLLNDGTAIVMFLVSYNMLSGIQYDFADIVMFLVKTAMMAWALGMFIGYFFFSWIRSAGNTLNPSSSMIQISLTICCAYWSFIIAEGVFEISGVLATVAASLILAHNMWPYIVSKDSVHHVWHTIEALGNIVVFFLAGALTGKAMVHIEFIDYLNLLVIYAFLFAVRGTFIFMSRPLLRLLSVGRDPVSREDATVMTWGGLRGAVGLALAIQVFNQRAPDSDGVPQIGEKEAERVLFFVSGIAFLTTVVNATTAPSLVKWLGITALPKAQRQLLRQLHHQLVLWSKDHSNPLAVTDSLKNMLQEIEHHIDANESQEDIQALWRSMSFAGPADSKEEGTAEGGKVAGGLSAGLAPSTRPPMMHLCTEETTCQLEDVDESPAARPGECSRARASSKSTHDAQNPRPRMSAFLLPGSELVEHFREAQAKHQELNKEDLELLGEFSQETLADQVDDLVDLLLAHGDEPRNRDMAMVVTKAFMQLVCNTYMQQISSGDLIPGSEAADVLLTSVRLALNPSNLKASLNDFENIKTHLLSGAKPEVATAGRQSWWKVFPEDIEDSLQGQSSRNLQAKMEQPSPLSKLLYSSFFNMCMSGVIIFNGIYVAADEAVRHPGNDSHFLWLFFESVFLVLFVAEFALKVSVLRLQYFKDAWNLFDFFLVVLGIFGLVITLEMHADQGDVSNEARIFRITRVFRVLRFLRIFRLFHARLSADKHVSLRIAAHMHRINVLMGFVHAHLRSQGLMVKYFGGNGKVDTPDEVELARCILQSKLCVYQAIEKAVGEIGMMSKKLYQELQWVNKRKQITEGLEKFVLSAYKDGAISGREAEAVLRPLHGEITKCMLAIRNCSDGILENELGRARVIVSDPMASPQAVH